MICMWLNWGCISQSVLVIDTWRFLWLLSSILRVLLWRYHLSWCRFCLSRSVRRRNMIFWRPWRHSRWEVELILHKFVHYSSVRYKHSQNWKWSLRGTWSDRLFAWIFEGLLILADDDLTLGSHSNDISLIPLHFFLIEGSFSHSYGYFGRLISSHI